MRNLKNTIIVLLISFSMSLSIFSTIGYAQFYEQENSINDNQTEANFENDGNNDNQEDKSQVSNETENLEGENPQNEDSENKNSTDTDDSQNENQEDENSTDIEDPQNENSEDENPTDTEEPENEDQEDENPSDIEEPQNENQEDENSSDTDDTENEDPETENPQTSATVTFRYLEEGTNKSIAKDNVEDMEVGDYNFSQTDAPEIEGYEFVNMTGDISGTIQEGSNVSLTVNMIYKAVENEEEPEEGEENDDTFKSDEFKVTYYYIDELTSREIYKRGVAYLPMGSNVNSNVIDIENYVYHHTVQVEFCDGTLGVYNFYGRANPTGQFRIKINYLEENTNKVLAKSFISDLVKNNFSYNVTCRDKLYIPGYKYVRTVGNVIGTINNNDVQINVYYKKVQQYRVTINFIDYNSRKQILKSFVSIALNDGDSYNVSRYENLRINGYTLYKTEGDAFKGTIDGNKVINMYYLKNGETAVKTGDFNNLLLWAGICVVAILILVVILLKSRKK